MPRVDPLLPVYGDLDDGSMEAGRSGWSRGILNTRRVHNEALSQIGRYDIESRDIEGQSIHGDWISHESGCGDVRVSLHSETLYPHRDIASRCCKQSHTWNSPNTL